MNFGKDFYHVAVGDQVFVAVTRAGKEENQQYEVYLPFHGVKGSEKKQKERESQRC